MDLIASKWNKKLQQFRSIRGLDKDSLSEAFFLPWVGAHVRLIYAFPPIPLIHKVLIKIKHNKANMILIAPTWPQQQQHWFSMLLELLTASR